MFTMAFKSIQMTYSLKPLHPWFSKFHMQHDEAAGLQNDEISLVEHQTWSLLLKIAKPLNSAFSSEPLDIYLTEILYRALI